MFGNHVIALVSRMGVSTYIGAEDFADRFNFIVTVIILLLCTTVVTSRQYVFNPISCYVATEVGGRNLLNYVENYCWVQGTLPINISDEFPGTEDAWQELESHKILYYQWVPFVLGLQCTMFCMPRIIWLLLCQNQIGTDLSYFVKIAKKAVRENTVKRTELLNHLAESLEQLLFQHREIHAGCAASVKQTVPKWCFHFCLGKRHGSQLFGSYLLIKVLYLLNAIGQLYLMHSFFGIQSKQMVDNLFGLSLAINILKGANWQATLMFPRIGFCVVPIRQLMGNVFVTAQCALPVNMLIEYIYIFLWFWLILNAIVTAISIPAWLAHMAYRKSRTVFVNRFLNLSPNCSYHDRLMVDRFCCQFLRQDGIFILRLISSNTGDIICGDIVDRLWTVYQKRYYNTNFNAAETDLKEANRGNRVFVIQSEKFRVQGSTQYRPVSVDVPTYRRPERRGDKEAMFQPKQSNL